MLPRGQGSAVETRDDGGTLQVGWFRSQGIAAITDQIEGSFVMCLLAFGFANVVQQSRSQQARSGRAAINRRLPSRGEKAIIELKCEACHALGMGEIRIEAI